MPSQIHHLTRRTGADQLREDSFPNYRHHLEHDVSHGHGHDVAEGIAMVGFLGWISSVGKIVLYYDDDFYDRLCHRYTIGVIAISWIIVSAKQYVGDPIHCWCPAHFIIGHEEYANNYCWISNTYYIPPDSNIPYDLPQRTENEITYYQWVPFILICMAALYYTPCVLWRLFCNRNGIDINGIVQHANDSHHMNMDPAVREKTMKYIARHMDRYLCFKRDNSTTCCTRCRNFLADKLCLFCGKLSGNYLIATYIAVKLLYIVNAVGQIFLLNTFMTTDEQAFYGIEILQHLINGTDWKASRRFPRVTLCDFDIRRMGGHENIHRYTVQCALPINLFNEKIFVFLWFWMALVAFLTIWGIVPWLYTLFTRSRYQYIKKHLNISDSLGSDKSLARTFSEKYLRQDGVFVLRIISKNSNDIIITELVQYLWEFFKKHRGKLFKKVNSV